MQIFFLFCHLRCFNLNFHPVCQADFNECKRNGFSFTTFAVITAVNCLWIRKSINEYYHSKFRMIIKYTGNAYFTFHFLGLKYIPGAWLSGQSFIRKTWFESYTGIGKLRLVRFGSYSREERSFCSKLLWRLCIDIFWQFNNYESLEIRKTSDFYLKLFGRWTL